MSSTIKDALVALVTRRQVEEKRTAAIGHPLHVNLDQLSPARAARQGARIRNLNIAIETLEKRISEDASTRNSKAPYDKMRSLRLERTRRLAALGILENE